MTAVRTPRETDRHPTARPAAFPRTHREARGGRRLDPPGRDVVHQHPRWDDFLDGPGWAMRHTARDTARPARRTNPREPSDGPVAPAQAAIVPRGNAARLSCQTRGRAFRILVSWMQNQGSFRIVATGESRCKTLVATLSAAGRLVRRSPPWASSPRHGRAFGDLGLGPSSTAVVLPSQLRSS